MQRLAAIRFRRRFSGFLAFLFAILTLLANSPHGHESAAFSTRQSRTAHALTTAASPCPLCHWLTVSYARPAEVTTSFVVVAAPIIRQFALPAVVLHRLSVLNPSLRAPPVPSF